MDVYILNCLVKTVQKDLHSFHLQHSFLLQHLIVCFSVYILFFSEATITMIRLLPRRFANTGKLHSFGDVPTYSDSRHSVLNNFKPISNFHHTCPFTGLALSGPLLHGS